MFVAINEIRASSRRMASTLSPQQAEQKLIGQALRNLREKKGLKQRDVAEPQGITTQAWQYYEIGSRRFTRDRIAIALGAIGASEHDLEAEKARILGTAPRNGASGEPRPDFVFDVYGRSRTGAHGAEVYGLAEPVRTFDLGQVLGRRVDAMEVAGDSMSPWVESGEIVLFDRERAPRRGKGCIIELVDGGAHVKLYEKSDGSTLFVRELFPQERTITFALKDVKGVYPVVFRGD